MSAYGRKQPSRRSLNGCFLTAALEEKAAIRGLELRARANGRNRPKVATSQPAESAYQRLGRLKLEACETQLGERIGSAGQTIGSQT